MDYAKSALTWLCFSERPLTLEELAEAVILKPFKPLDETERLLDSELIISICGSFVSYNKHFLDKRVVVLSHYSVKEYLVSERFQHKAELSAWATAIHRAQKTLGECCLTHVQHSRSYIPDSDIDLGPGLLNYYVVYGFHHFEKTPETDRRMMEAFLFSHFDRDKFRPYEAFRHIRAGYGDYGPIFFFFFLLSGATSSLLRSVC